MLARLRAWLGGGEHGYRRLLLGILALGLLVRLIHFATLAATAYPRLPLVLTQTDLHATWRWAVSILDGDLLGRETYHPYFDWMRAIAPLETWYRWWGGRETFQQAPLYPYWVAALLALSGRSLTFVLFGQLVVGALTPWVVFALAQGVFGDRRISLLAGALVALYGPLVFFQGTLLRDWLPPLVQPLVLAMALGAAARARGRAWVGTGALGGLAVLVKESALLLFPVLLLWLGLIRREGPTRVLRAAGLLGLGAAASLAPLVLRNVAVGAPPLALSNRFAETFVQANAADSLPLVMNVPPSLARILEESGGAAGGVIRATLATHRERWWGFLEHQLMKLRALVDPLEIPNNLDFYYGREISPILRALPGYGLLLPLAAAGLLLALPGSGSPQRLLGLYTVGTTAGLLAGPMFSRYRLVLIPALALYASVGAVHAWDAARRHDTKRWAVYLALVTATAVTQQVAAPIATLRALPGVMVHHLEYVAAAQLYAQAGQFDMALAEIHRLRQRAERHPGFTWLRALAAGEEVALRSQWAARLIGQRRLRDALSHVDAAARLADTYPGAVGPLIELGVLYAQLGRSDRAAAYLRRAIEREPAGPSAGLARHLLLRLGATP